MRKNASSKHPKNDATQYLEKGALTCTVSANNAQAFASFDFERNIVNSPEFFLAKSLSLEWEIQRIAYYVFEAVKHRALQGAAELLAYSFDLD
jgi:hypothetical protein